MDVSMVIPLFNEEESLNELVAWIDKVCVNSRLQYEVILVDDGSTDSSWYVVQDLSKRYQNVKGIKFRRNYGKSAALNVGFEAAEGEVVITMDADLQDNPDEIPELYSMVKEQGYHLVSGWKKQRRDPLNKRIPSKFFNRFTQKMSGIKLHDFNCGLKAYDKAVVKNIEVYGEMHRYIPVLAKNAGFTNITQKEVIHQARKYGTTKFGYERFINGFLDLITIAFISKYGKRPMHLFGTLGVIMFLIGFIIAGYVGISKLYRMAYDIPYNLVTDNPWFFIALTSMILGTLFFIAGFLGELILRNGHQGNRYTVAQEI